MSLIQYGFQYRNDDGSESGATPFAAENTNASLPLNTPKRLRIGVNADGTAPVASKYRLEGRLKPSGAWFEVGPAGTGGRLELAPSANIAAGGENTTAQLTPPAGKTTGDFEVGRMWDDESGQDTVSLADNKYTELEFCEQAVPANGAEDTDVYEHRLVRMAGSTGNPAAVAFVDSPQTVNAGSTLTKTGASLGTAFASRRVFIVVAGALGFERTPVSCTIGGISATTHVGTAPGAEHHGVWMFSAIVPTGTTADVVITASDEMFFAPFIGIYTTDDDLLVAASPTVQNSSVAGTPVNLSIAAEAGAFGILAAGWPSGNAKTITDPSEWTLASAPDDRHRFYYQNGLSTGTLNPAVSWSGFVEGASLAALTWR